MTPQPSWVILCRSLRKGEQEYKSYYNVVGKNKKRDEPSHHKTNKMDVCPAKIQISLGIRCLIRVFAVLSMDS